ncbi:hypothetical protein Q8A67_017199 [Cirrhinus molitorella]|uniref:TRIM8/14/16/25/29/45/65 coiled-coil region domain-containing protein n=1 Tax=Cirrhinus molitorella TaxID=172907 RepID=A0AA88PHU2_9TELE|nr:hypothetical protein Q8A67_017199 [Cirrhinus molitorella]
MKGVKVMMMRDLPFLPLPPSLENPPTLQRSVLRHGGVKRRSTRRGNRGDRDGSERDERNVTGLDRDSFDFGSAVGAEERTEKQKHLEQTQRDSQQRIHQREKDLQELREVVKTHKHSAQKALEDSERNFTELIHSIERSRSEVTQLIRDQEKAAVSRAEELMKLMEQEIDDLKRKNAELEQLLQTDDHIRFLMSVESCYVPPQATVVPRIKANSHLLYDSVGKSVFLLKKNLEIFCKEVMGDMSCTVRDIKIISTSEETVQSPQPQSWATMPRPLLNFHPASESTSSRPPMGPRSRSLTESKYWCFAE